MSPFKVASALLFCLVCASVQASDTELLERALTCQLRDDELSSLVKNLATQRPDFDKPTTRYGAPSADV